MIVRDRPSGLQLFLIVRGSVLPSIRNSLLVTTLLAALVSWTGGELLHHKITLTAIPFTLMGLPLAIFLGFRNNAAYDRYWEGRKQWGELVLQSRNLARQCLTLIDPDTPYARAPGDLRGAMVRRAIGFAHALRQRLRGEGDPAEIAAWVSAEEWQRVRGATNLTYALMLEMGADLARATREGRLDPLLTPALDATLSHMTAAVTACERIKTTPIPFSYTLLLHRTAYLYCFLLPFGLVDTIGYLTPLVVVIVAYTIFGLDALGDEIEEPFGSSDHDLPLDALCRTIEIDLRTALGDGDVPPPMAPVDYWLG
ncbi:bestrophin family protein [Massilia terrae]|uniref:Bestrophin n=1 Tax=Massilia terrae TaxID=1811224 RepID=A0ABT2D487_9BURK|nr:bestrophin family ion channel [Massilia terrae]MCS0661021.1 bestrophin [Massilia terrae]